MTPRAPDARDHCPLREWGCTATTVRPTWRLLSRHSTSDGDIEYCECSCDAVVMLHQGRLAKFTAPPAEQH
ncbi:hypothetical protein ACE14D_03545 [Streptomyces sp. Act-28]